MPTETRPKAAMPAMHPLAARRILRLAFGTALSLAVTQAFGWPLAFIAPILTMLLLALPLPAPGILKGVAIVLAMLLPMVAGLALLPLLMHARWAGIVLVGLALFYTFYFTARGGSPVLGTFMTIGITVVVTVGSVNQDLLVLLIGALAGNALVGVAFVWLAHLLWPDPRGLPAPPDRPKPAAPPPAVAARNALRALLIVLPLALVFLFASGSPAYTPVMIKVASMGQQASGDDSRAMGRSLLASTWWGSVAAVLAWWLLSAWPSLVPYALATALAGLVFGRRIFEGAAVRADFSTWSYAFLTMLVLLGPAVTDSPLSDGVGFVQRLLLFGLIAVYGTTAVVVFDAFFSPGDRPASTSPPSRPTDEDPES